MTDLQQRLHDLRPCLNYDREEPFYADAAEVFVENRYADGPLVAYSTRLLRADGDVVAATDHHDPARRLHLGFLRPGTYPTSDPVLDGDHLDPGGEWVADARRGHVAAERANRIYGRIADSRAGGHWLQYWFFYFASVKGIPSVKSATGPLGFGLHAGDWEMIQLYVPQGASEPTRATYAAHAYAFRVDDVAAEEWPAGVPQVYVALGSHASYPRPGKWRNRGEGAVLGFFKKLDDRCLPDASVRPELIVLDDAADGWWSWPGRWGRSHGPASPACQDQWTQPDDLHEHALDIGEGLRDVGLEETGGPPPGAPEVVMAQEGRRVTLTFDVPDEAEQTWAALLTLALDTAHLELPVAFAYDVTRRGRHRPLTE